MFVMLVVVTILTKDCVHTDIINEADFYIQLYKKTFFQHLTNDLNPPARFEDNQTLTLSPQNVTQLTIPQYNVTQHNVTQRNVSQRNVTQQNVPQQIKEETKHSPECNVDGKKCEYEAEDADREDHFTQVVDDMFVNTDSEITSLQVNEQEDGLYSSVPDAQAGPDQNSGLEETMAALSRK